MGNAPSWNKSETSTVGETFSMSIKTTYKGKFAKLDVNRVVTQDRERYMKRVGDVGVEEMKSRTSPHDWTGELTGSIAWRTQSEFSPVTKNENLVDRPDNPEEIAIGSKCKYAFFREFGAGIHGSADGSAEFIDRMKAWFRDKIGGDPEGEGSSVFWAIVNNIRYGDKATNGTQNMAPFVAPATPAIIKAARHYSKTIGINKYLGR